ncbi:MAG TPA: alpha/beta fold hydrolase [Myxococcales bacterium]|nr:alpha/beta fold hydrolase [Myxococcales bacterium]
MTPSLLIALVAAAVALALLAGGGVVLVRRRRRRAAVQREQRPQRRPQQKIARPLPVVLAHGILGFDKLPLPVSGTEYFRGVADRLRGLGMEVHTVRVPPLSSVKDRAEDLARAVRQLDSPRVNIIAHSMGGLDSRYAIAKLGLAARVASLTTVGTPHRGTPLADAGTEVLGDRLKLRGVLEKLGIDVNALYDLTTARMQEFNESVPDASGVLYGCYLARTKGLALALNPLLLPTYLYLSDRAGENDGLVPTHSQRWGEQLGQVEADHWAQIGWSATFDAPTFYAQMVRELVTRGL